MFCSLRLIGLKERLNREMMQIRPFQAVYNIVVAKDVNSNAWHGARDLANSNSFSEYLISKNDYLEYGGEYIKEHYASNKYFPTPSQTSIEPDITNNDASTMKIENDSYVE